MNWSPQSLKSRVQQLPPLPKATSRLLEMLEDDELNGDMKQIEKQILGDPILTGRILQIANSSFYGLRQKIVSISQACSILGLHTLKNLVYTMAIMERLNQPHDLSVIHYNDVWRHSLLTASIAGAVAKDTTINAVTAFTTGLFHNIGLLIMDFLYPTALQQQIDLARKKRYSLPEAAAAMSAPSHQSLAVTVLEVWNFPPNIIAPFIEPEEPAVGSRPSAQSLQLVSMSALLAHGLGVSYLEGITTPWSLGADTTALGKDVAALWQNLDEGLATYRDLSQALL